LKCGVVTGGGSGTYRLEAASGIFTEVQPGELCIEVLKLWCCHASSA
jgi:D-serine deaminase-like pyridoxal phosphate-dependent protein